MSGLFPTIQTPMSETTKVIYPMTGVAKEVNRKVILKNIHLGCYYGAKIGVLGLNGSGKSTLHAVSCRAYAGECG